MCYTGVCPQSYFNKENIVDISRYIVDRSSTHHPVDPGGPGALRGLLLHAAHALPPPHELDLVGELVVVDHVLAAHLAALHRRDVP